MKKLQQRKKEISAICYNSLVILLTICFPDNKAKAKLCSSVPLSWHKVMKAVTRTSHWTWDEWDGSEKVLFGKILPFDF
jgi:hypothetical protein